MNAMTRQEHAEMDAPLSFSLNGKQVTASASESILQVAKREGLEIPHLCFREGMQAVGNCRACMVEIDGERVKFDEDGRQSLGFSLLLQTRFLGSPGAGFGNATRLGGIFPGRCCRTLTDADSHCESMWLDGQDEQAITHPLPHDELV